MVNFETEIYHRQEDDVIGMKVMVIADSGQTIDSIHCINETDFLELESRLDTLNEEYVQFDEDSTLKGTTIDEILANASEIVTINATRLNGLQSDDFAKTNHTHLKQSITNLYDYNISLSKYNLDTEDSITVTVNVTDMNGSPINNHDVIIYKNGTFWKSGKTNINGTFSTNYTTDSSGLISFSVKNQHVQCFIKDDDDSGWETVSLISSKFEHYNSDSILRCRRIGKIVHIRGAVKNKKQITFSDYDDFTNIIGSIKEEFRPPRAERIIQQGSDKNNFLINVGSNGDIVIARYGVTKLTSIPAGSWINCFITYFID